MAQIVTLSEVCELNPKHRLAGLVDDLKVSFVGMANVSEITRSVESSSEKNLSAARKGFTHFANDDVIVAKITPCYENGKIAVVNVPHKLAFGSTEFHVFRTNKEKILPKFLFYFLSSPSVRNSGAKSMTGSAGQKRVPIKFFQKLKVLLPTLEDQKHIVRALDAADLLRQKRKLAMSLLDDYLNSVFLDMFDEKIIEKWLPLNEVSNFIDYRGKTPVKTNSGVQLITAKNVKEGYIDYQPEEFIAEENYLDWMRRGFPKEGDILFTTEAPLGNTAILPKFDKLAFAQRVIIIQPKSFLVPEFLLFALNSKKVKQDIFSRSTGSTVKGIRSKELVKVKIPLPPIGLQNKFAEIVVKTERLKQTMLIQSDKLEGNFNALMQKTFNE